jgi:hypothetical protein
VLIDTAKEHFEQQNLETECTGAIRRWTFSISRRRKKIEKLPIGMKILLKIAIWHDDV